MYTKLSYTEPIKQVNYWIKSIKEIFRNYFHGIASGNMSPLVLKWCYYAASAIFMNMIVSSPKTDRRNEPNQFVTDRHSPKYLRVKACKMIWCAGMLHGTFRHYCEEYHYYTENIKDVVAAVTVRAPVFGRNQNSAPQIISTGKPMEIKLCGWIICNYTV